MTPQSFFKPDDLLTSRANLNISFPPQFHKKKETRWRNKWQQETAEDTVEQE